MIRPPRDRQGPLSRKLLIWIVRVALAVLVRQRLGQHNERRDFRAAREPLMKRNMLFIAIATMSIGLAQIAPPVSAQEPIQPIKPARNIDLGLTELGKKLYFPARWATSGSRARSIRQRC